MVTGTKVLFFGLPGVKLNKQDVFVEHCVPEGVIQGQTSWSHGGQR